MDRRRVIAIALGGALGAACRWAILTTFTPTGRWPWPLLAVNVVGSLVLGVLLAEEWDHPGARLWLHDAGGIGFCGGLTTFSTLSVEVVDLLRQDETATALGYGALSVALCVLSVIAGAALLRRVRALSLPLEEQP